MLRLLRTGAILAALLGLCLPAAGVAASGRPTAAAGLTGLTGTLRAPGHERLAGMRVEAVPVSASASACSSTTGCASTYSGTRGTFSLSGLAAGSYAVDVVDGLQVVQVRTIAVPHAKPLTLTLPAPAVPAGTSARLARRALGWLDAERRRAGVPDDVVLNPRWSQECAAHDAYELANATLASGEDPAASGYSLGGAWAGESSDLAAGRWSAKASPWDEAPVSLLALLSPSLSVTGIDDGAGRQCAVTFPGMLRRPPARDTVTTVPADGSRGVPTSELARESPFTPVQFVGLPASRTTGRELFVYLNRAGELGQAPVVVTAATLRRGARRVAVRWVDARTHTIGADLAGAILVPLAPLAPDATYRATVSVRDGTRILRHAWSFQTAAARQSS